MSTLVPRLLLVAIFTAAATLQGVAGVSILACFNSLDRVHYIENGDYRLAMEDPCNVALYRKSQLLWHAGGKGSDCSAQLEGSGDLVIRDSQGAVSWRSYSIQANRNYLILDRTGTVSIKTLVLGEVLWSASYPPPGAAAPAPALPAPPPPSGPTSQVWAAQAGVLYMVAGYQLPKGTPLQNGIFVLRLNQSCYLDLLRDNGTRVWGSDTGGSAGDDDCALALQENGTLQILNGDKSVAWQSQSNRSGAASVDSYVLFLGDDGKVSVFDSLQLKTSVWTGFNGLSQLSKKQSQSWKAVVGIVVGVVFALFAFGVIFWVLTVYYGYGSGCMDPAGKDLTERLQANGGRCQALSLAKIRQATNGFEKKLGEGGFGSVYYGRLSDGQEVAIKVLSATSRQGKAEFFNEIELLSVVHHKYLVSLVGYCLAWKRQILVYEYISGGDLQERLHAASNPLTWKERTSIILQVAEGIEYLHHGCPKAIIHRDLKSSNILLTDRMVAKVGDFGLSKIIADEHNATHITTVVKGTFGYLDPEYSITGNLTEKSDVYAFGVLLMEILTGRSLTDKEGVFIINRVGQAFKSGEVEQLADPNMGGRFVVSEFVQLIKLSRWCVKKHSHGRPSMSKVVQELRDAGLVQLGPLRSSNYVEVDVLPSEVDILPPICDVLY